MNGADVYGIDLGPSFPEDKLTYKHIQKDVIDVVMKKKLRKIREIKKIKFDVINSSFFVGKRMSPTLEEKLREKGYWRYAFEKSLLEQLKDVTAENGLIMLENEHFRKISNQLVRLPLSPNDIF